LAVGVLGAMACNSNQQAIPPVTAAGASGAPTISVTTGTTIIYGGIAHANGLSIVPFARSSAEHFA
jgi:hypothetical protein